MVGYVGRMRISGDYKNVRRFFFEETKPVISHLGFKWEETGQAVGDSESFGFFGGNIDIEIRDLTMYGIFFNGMDQVDNDGKDTVWEIDNVNITYKGADFGGVFVREDTKYLGYLAKLTSKYDVKIEYTLVSGSMVGSVIEELESAVLDHPRFMVVGEMKKGNVVYHAIHQIGEIKRDVVKRELSLSDFGV